MHEQLVPKTESRTKWVLFGLELGQSWAGLASRERRQNQKRPTGRSLYNREGKPHRHNRDALDSLMIWLGLNLCQRGRQGDIKKRKKGIYKKAWKKEKRVENAVHCLCINHSSRNRGACTLSLFSQFRTNHILDSYKYIVTQYGNSASYNTGDWCLNGNYYKKPFILIPTSHISATSLHSNTLKKCGSHFLPCFPS